jgi:hypothetical protein
VPLFGPLDKAMARVPAVFLIPASLGVVPLVAIAVNCEVLVKVGLDDVYPPPCSTKPGTERWKIELL